MKTEAEIRNAILLMEQDLPGKSVLYHIPLLACISMAQWILGDDNRETRLIQEGIDKGSFRKNSGVN